MPAVNRGHPCAIEHFHPASRDYFARLITEATIAASEAVEVIMPITFCRPLPLRSIFCGTTISQPGSTFG